MLQSIRGDINERDLKIANLYKKVSDTERQISDAKISDTKKQ